MATQALGIPTILSHYKIIEKIGEGGMGAVYCARDMRLDREVAIKVIPPHALADTAARRRFRHEALALSKLNHPSIATIHDFDTDQGIDFLVMEYIPGATLSDLVKTGPLPLQEVLRVGVQMLEALAAAHARGIVHRDLKPANLRRMPDGRIKVLDFGVAKAMRVGASAETMTYTGAVGPCGTLPYMAPEQVRGEECDERSDLYGAGAVLYELATGRQLFPGKQSGQLIDAILHEDPGTPKSLVPELPEEFERVILRALNKDPNARFQSAAEFLTEVRRLSGESTAPVTYKTTWRARPMWRLVLRHRRAALIGLVCVIAAVAMLSYLRTPALAFTARDFLVITDFDNQTGDPLFEKSLTTAFVTSMGQSAYANVVSRQRMMETLKRMKRPPTEKIDEAIAREIARREGLNVLIIPSITAVGDRYSVGARIHDVEKGRDFRSEVVAAKGKNEVLGAIDKLTTQIRRDIGESREAIAQTTKPLAQVTTASLEALQQFSLGTEQRRSGKVDEARTYFQNALRIDPNFTAARASLGALMIDMASLQMPGYDFEEGKKLLEEASRNLMGLTDRERYGIQAFRASKIDHKPDEAIANYKALLAIYPDDLATHSNLSWLYAQLGRFQEAITEGQIAMRLDASFVIAQLNLGYVYLYRLGDVPSGLDVYNHILAVEPDNAWAYDGIGWANLARGNWTMAQRSFERAIQINPQQLLSRYRLAHAYRLAGDHAKAVEALLELRRLFPNETSALYDEAINRDAMGQHEEAMRLWTTFREKTEAEAKRSKALDTRMDIAATLARMGRKDEATKMVNAALRAKPDLGFSAATALALLGRKDEAVKQLQIAMKAGYDNMIFMKIHPDLEPLHGYPAFERLFEGKLKL